MKVEKLIESLKIYNSDMDVYVCDEVEGNDSPLTYLEESTREHYDHKGKLTDSRKILLLRSK